MNKEKSKLPMKGRTFPNKTTIQDQLHLDTQNHNDILTTNDILINASEYLSLYSTFNPLFNAPEYLNPLELSLKKVKEGKTITLVKSNDAETII
jgi:hypothetical protein